MARTYRRDVDHLRYEWGGARAGTTSCRDSKSPAVPRSPSDALDTSTGVVADVRAIAERDQRLGRLDRRRCDLEPCGCSARDGCLGPRRGRDELPQGAHVSAGLAAVAVSPAAAEAAKHVTSPRFYFDWERMLASHAKNDTPFSPAISLVLGLDVALDLVLEKGLEAAHERHVRLGRACRAGVKAMGLELFSPDEDRAAVVTAIRVPAEIDSSAIVLAMRDRSGVTVVGGQRAQGQDRPHRPHRLHRRPRRRDGPHRPRARARRGRRRRRTRSRGLRCAGGARRARHVTAADGNRTRILIREPIADAGVALLRALRRGHRPRR